MQKGINNFESAAVSAAHWLRLKYKFVLSEDHSDTAIKDRGSIPDGHDGRKFI